MNQAFANWVKDQIRHAPEDILAFAFNLYENKGEYSVELVGSRAFWPDNTDWACEEDFVPSPRRRWDIPKGLSGSDWETCLKAMKRSLHEVLQSGFVERLLLADAVAIGFVDGDLQVVFPQQSARVIQ